MRLDSDPANWPDDPDDPAERDELDPAGARNRRRLDVPRGSATARPSPPPPSAGGRRSGELIRATHRTLIGVDRRHPVVAVTQVERIGNRGIRLGQWLDYPNAPHVGGEDSRTAQWIVLDEAAGLALAPALALLRGEPA
jgi:hypothetical protein